MARAAASLRTLLANLIDYAGLYPPAALPLAEVLENYERYRASAESWMLNRLVLPAANLAEAAPRPGWRITLLVEDEPAHLPPQVETFEMKTARRLSRPAYCEAALDAIPQGAFAKVRPPPGWPVFCARRPRAASPSKPPPGCTIPGARCGL